MTKRPFFGAIVPAVLLLVLLGGCQAPTSMTDASKGLTIVLSTPSRTVIPGWATTIHSYGILLKCTSNQLADITQTAVQGASSVSIPSVPQGTWTITVSGLDSNSLTIASGSASVIVNANGTTTPTSVTVVLSGNQTATGQGDYNFSFEFPVVTGIDSVSAQLLTAAGATIAGTQGTVTNLNTFTTVSPYLKGSFSQTGVTSGTYILRLTFYRGAIVAGVYSEAINVFDNLTSDHWFASGQSLTDTRIFDTSEFNESNAYLASLTATISGVAFALNPSFSSTVLNYTNESAATVTVTPVVSVLGEYLRYQLNSTTGTWNPMSSGLPVTVSPGNTLYIKVTATDGTSTRIYGYQVTTLFGESAPLSLSGTVSNLGSGYNSPRAVATDGTSVYVADAGNSRIAKVPIGTGVVSTLRSGFNCPEGITIDGTNLYVSDSANHQIYKMSATDGSFSVLAGAGASGSGTAGYLDGAGSVALFNTPKGLATDGLNLYVADGANHRIRKVVISTGYVSTLAGSGTAAFADGVGTAASFNNPSGLATDGVYLYVTDMDNGRIRKILISTGEVTTLAGSGGTSFLDGPGSSAIFNRPYGLATDGTNLYVADNNNHLIRKVVIATGVVSTLAGVAGSSGTTNGAASSAQFKYPWGVAVDGSHVYVGDTYNSLIRIIQ